MDGVLNILTKQHMDLANEVVVPMVSDAIKNKIGLKSDFNVRVDNMSSKCALDVYIDKQRSAVKLPYSEHGIIVDVIRPSVNDIRALVDSVAVAVEYDILESSSTDFAGTLIEMITERYRPSIDDRDKFIQFVHLVIDKASSESSKDCDNE